MKRSSLQMSPGCLLLYINNRFLWHVRLRSPLDIRWLHKWKGKFRLFMWLVFDPKKTKKQKGAPSDLQRVPLEKNLGQQSRSRRGENLWGCNCRLCAFSAAYLAHFLPLISCIWPWGKQGETTAQQAPTWPRCYQPSHMYTNVFPSTWNGQHMFHGTHEVVIRA